MPTVEKFDIVTVDAGALSGLARAEIDMQIATAHRFPRNISKFESMSKALVCIDEETAMEMIYSVERGTDDDGRKKFVEGPSIRMAEILQSCWGNCRSGARVVDEGPEFITAQGVFHDLERNVATTREVQRRITNKKGHRYNRDMITVTGNAAASIALRNAITTGIPRPYWQPIYTSAKTLIIGDARALGPRRDKAIEMLGKMGLPVDDLLAWLDVIAVKDVTQEHLLRLRGLVNALRDGDASIDSLRRSPPATSQRGEKADIGAKLRTGGNGPAEPQDGRNEPAGQPEAGDPPAPSRAAASKATPVPAPPGLNEAQRDLWQEIGAALESATAIMEVDILRQDFAASIDATVTPGDMTADFNKRFDDRIIELNNGGRKAAAKL